jgi:hypothetical protein
MRSILLRPVDDMELYFETDGARVLDATKFEYVRQKVHDVLVGSREEQLNAVKAGFDEALGPASEALKAGTDG